MYNDDDKEKEEMTDAFPCVADHHDVYLMLTFDRYGGESGVRARKRIFLMRSPPPRRSSTKQP